MASWYESFKKNPLWALVLSVIVLATIMFLIVWGIQNRLDNTRLRYDMSLLKNDIEALSVEKLTLQAEKQKLIDQLAQTIVDNDRAVDALNTELQQLLNQYTYAHVPSKQTLQSLKDRGIASPEALLTTLEDASDLIPYDGVLGGTMRFWPSESHVLDSNWVLGYFEDGHIVGYALLGYSIENNHVTWRLIEAVLY